MEKKLTSWKDLKKGTKFKIIKNTSGHNYPLETIFTLSRDGESKESMSDIAKEFPGGNFVHIKEVQLYPRTIPQLRQEKSDLIKKLSTITLEIDVIEDKIKYMIEHKLEEFDEEEYQIFQMLEIVECPNLSKFEKVKLISNLIKNI